METENINAVYTEDGTCLLMLNDEHAVTFEVPYGVEVIGEDAFTACQDLCEVILPKTLKEIENWAFAGCRSLQKISIPASVLRIGMNCFVNCDCLNAFIVDESNIKFQSVDGVLFDKGCTEVLGFPPAKQKEHYEVPSGVLRIGYGAFESSRYLKSVRLPVSLKTLSDDAFNGCHELEEICFGDELTDIGDRAFCGCQALRNLALPTSVKVIGAYTFSGCSSLTDVVLPIGTTEVHCNAFCGCEKLGTVRIPATVRTMEECALSHCPQLSDIIIDIVDPRELNIEDLVMEGEDISKVMLHVPSGSMAFYRVHPFFGRFERIEEI